MNSGSLYYFFKTKDDLLLAGLDLFQVLVYPIVMEPAFTRESDPVEKIFAVLEDYRQRLVVTGLEYECPIGKLSLEVDKFQPFRDQVGPRIVISENICVTLE